MASRELNFTMQRQLQDEWCWSATSTSTSHFYDSSSPWTQCKLADSALGQTTCCQNPSSAACNHSYYLNRALAITGNFSSVSAGAQPLSVLQTEVDAGRPLGWRIQWRPKGGHFGMLVGYDTRANTVDVRDPWYGNSEDLPYNTFKNNYQGAGYWNYSYFTKK